MRSSRSGSAIGNRRSPTGREESSRRTSRRSRPTRKLPSLWSREASAEREVPRESASAERLGPLGPPPRCGDELLGARDGEAGDVEDGALAADASGLLVDAAAALDRRAPRGGGRVRWLDRKSTRLNSSHGYISYAVFCLKKKNTLQPILSSTTSSTLTSLQLCRARLATEPDTADRTS